MQSIGTLLFTHLLRRQTENEMDLPSPPISQNSPHSKAYPINLGYVVRATAVVLNLLQLLLPHFLYIYLFSPPIKLEHRFDAWRERSTNGWDSFQPSSIVSGLPPQLGQCTRQFGITAMTWSNGEEKLFALRYALIQIPPVHLRLTSKSDTQENVRAEKCPSTPHHDSSSHSCLYESFHVPHSGRVKAKSYNLKLCVSQGC